MRGLLQSRKGDSFAESAIVLPIILLVTIALMNLSMAGFASVNANNAANYGARVGSVHQQGPRQPRMPPPSSPSPTPAWATIPSLSLAEVFRGRRSTSR